MYHNNDINIIKYKSNNNHKMVKHLMIIAMACLMAPVAFAQNVLEVTDVSQPNDVYSSDDGKAVVVVKCNKTIPLMFESTMDKTADPYNTLAEGNDSIYYIEFPTGSRYRGRQLSIKSPGYNTVTISLEDLKPKQAVTLLAVDPNSMVDAGCYRGHRNRGLEELKKMNYNEARIQFEVATECSDVDTIENNENLALVDSIIYYRNKAELLFKMHNYREAANLYKKVLMYNSYDSYANDRQAECMLKYVDECSMTMEQAQYYDSEKQYQQALPLYRQIVENDCPSRLLAQQQINRIELLLNQRKNHSRVFTYEYTKDTPIGFSYGKYNMHKVGGFFGMSVNKNVFDMMRNDCTVGDMPEVNVNFGWTIKIASPVWVFFGPGATVKCYYGDYKPIGLKDKIYPNKDGFPNDPDNKLVVGSDQKEGSVYTNNDTKANAAWAISPVAGIAVKYSYFALRLTYQYRFAMDTNLKDFIGQQAFSVGVGVSF